MIDYSEFFADRVKPMKGSAIREMFKRMADPEIISLAGGNPAAELFPSDELSKIAGKILMTSPIPALQYGTTDGYPKMKDCAIERAKKAGAYNEGDEVLITTGANQGIDLTAKAIINKGDKIIVENPSFIGSLNAFRTYECQLVGVDVESDGMDVVKLEETLKANPDAKLLYTIPTFQNPTGTTMSLEKRKRVLELASEYNVLIIEDNPYGDLRFRGEEIATLKSLDTENRVIYCGSFSKILSPGMRLGYIIGPAPLFEKIEMLKQVNDVHTPMLTQLMCVQFMKKYNIDTYIEKNRKLYKEKCDCMIEAMNEYFPAGKVEWTVPDGGIFLWCKCPGITDVSEIVNKALEKKVAIVPGSNFAIDQKLPSNQFRLNFSSASKENITEGVRRLGEVLTELL
ncbi:MAG: PLP-dependent aminotransferase family protein [Clostridia bacterium]|nr:PLP-dependent aminotransferase family protein [Clostridia bacterium]MEE0409362.1 PLP-dependent aminotransferase family protein [Clostridia bacterium]